VGGIIPPREDGARDLAIYYNELREIDRRIETADPPKNLGEDLERLEKTVRQMRVTSKKARALYTLRQHLTLVRERLRL
jgi:hypothetical protein